MRYHVMIRSFEGSRLTYDSRGAIWRRREVWSTWTICDDYGEALEEQARLRRDGNGVLVVDEEHYPTFCASHTIC